MKFTEKLWYLRTVKHLSREQLAELCDVTVQAVTKWENGETFPKPEKLILISDIFEIPTDVLLKDDLRIGEIKESSCSSNCIVTPTHSFLYEGILIKESIEDDSIIDILNIHKVELWKTNSVPKYWTALTFSSNAYDLPERISKVIINTSSSEGKWFVDFKFKNIKFVVLRDLVLKYEIGNTAQKEAVCEKCRELGIPDCQMNWGE